MSETATNPCRGEGYAFGRFHPCPNRGTLEHDGKLWCKTHHPPTAKAKRDARNAKWDAKWDEQNAREAAEAAAQAALEADAARFRWLVDQWSASTGWSKAFREWDGTEDIRAAFDRVMRQEGAK